MLRQAREIITNRLWDTYRIHTEQMRIIESGLQQKNITIRTLDHYAVIDLPGPNSGISVLTEIFSALGYIERGKDYLVDKQNDFLWMAERDYINQPAQTALPQVVVADFRLEEMPTDVRRIVEKYSCQSQPAPLAKIKALAARAAVGDASVVTPLADLVTAYLTGRDWPLPTVRDFQTVQAFNELIAWVLIFGRRPNHFTVSVHHLDPFTDIAEFHRFVENELGLHLNHEGGKIKGGLMAGIAQGSTSGLLQTIPLADGEISIPTGFVEFVWRYPHAEISPPINWDDYFRGFIPLYADRVIESLYLTEKKDILGKVQG